MRLGIASWSFILCALLLFLIAQDIGARKIATEIEEKEATNELQNSVTDGHILTIIQAEKEDVQINNKHVKTDDDDDDSDDEDEDEDEDDDDSDDEEEDDDDEEKHKKKKEKHHMDPELNVFFTPKDLKIGKKMPIFFAQKNSSTSPKFLPREKSDQIPFSSKHLPSLLTIFSFPKHSPQAKAMKYTLKQCEFQHMEGETKFCATSLESLLDFTHKIFGPNSQFKVLSTTYLTSSSVPLQNYTITHVNKVTVPKVVGCHPLPYPYAVLYCHAQERDTNLYEVLVEGEDGAKVEAKAVCHMDTSKWNTDHVAFDVLKVQPGTSPVCHFFPPDNLVCVPLPSSL